MINEMCPCGLPLHYSSVAVAAHVLSQIKQLGPNVKVKIEGHHGAYMVPRHWIALHGLIAFKLEELAKDYGWEYVPDVPEGK